MPTNDPQVTKQVHAQQMEWVQLFNNKQWDRIASTYYAEDITFLPPNAPTVKGRSNVKSFMSGIGEMFSNVRITPGPVYVSGDMLVTHGQYQAKLTTPNGEVVDDRGKFLEAWRKERDGSWKVFLDTFTSDIEPISH